MTSQVLLLATLVMAFGALVQGVLGFGGALVSVPLLLLMDPRLVPGPTTIAGTVLTALIVWREPPVPAHLGLRWAVGGLPIGTLAAAWAVTVWSSAALAGAVAVLVLGAVATTVAGLRLEPTGRTQLAAGFLSGFMATTASIGGPPIALLHQHLSGPALRATLSRFFLASSVLALLALSVTGHLPRSDVHAGLLLAPASVVGFGLSGPLRRYLDGPATRWAVLIISTLSASAVLIRLVT